MKHHQTEIKTPPVDSDGFQLVRNKKRIQQQKTNRRNEQNKEETTQAVKLTDDDWPSIDLISDPNAFNDEIPDPDTADQMDTTENIHVMKTAKKISRARHDIDYNQIIDLNSLTDNVTLVIKTVITNQDQLSVIFK